MDESIPLGTPLSRSMNHLDQSTLSASTDMVRLLFGVPGTCWGSFSCSHARISGRMYATTTSVLFYSNVLGFERRFCLNFADIIDVSLHRTTSLRFELGNDEVYVFRSFHDREQVLGLLSRLKRVSGKDSMDPSNVSLVSSQQLRGRSETTRTVLLDVDQLQEESSLNFEGASYSTGVSQAPLTPSDRGSDQLVHPHSAPVRMNRKRAVSDSVVRLLGYGDDDVPEETRNPLVSIHEEQQRPALSHAMSAPLLEGNETDPTIVWEAEKAKALTFENTGVEDVRLKCTLDEYFDLFLSDSSTHSFTHFQKDVIEDKDVTITDWTIIDELTLPTGSTIKEYHRTLSFTHPLKNSIGPSEAHTQRQQTLKRFSSHGMILTNSTQVAGIPAADCFKAEDFWIIEAENNESIMVSARFAPRFHKRSMLKGLIERSIKRETTEWFRLYFDMARAALEDRSRSSKPLTPKPKPPEDVESGTLLATLVAVERIYTLLFLALMLLLVICIILITQVIQSNELMRLMKAQAMVLGANESCQDVA